MTAPAACLPPSSLQRAARGRPRRGCTAGPAAGLCRGGGAGRGQAGGVPGPPGRGGGPAGWPELALQHVRHPGTLVLRLSLLRPFLPACVLAGQEAICRHLTLAPVVPKDVTLLSTPLSCCLVRALLPRLDHAPGMRHARRCALLTRRARRLPPLPPAAQGAGPHRCVPAARSAADRPGHHPGRGEPQLLLRRQGAAHSRRAPAQAPLLTPAPRSGQAAVLAQLRGRLGRGCAVMARPFGSASPSTPRPLQSLKQRRPALVPALSLSQQLVRALTLSRGIWLRPSTPSSPLCGGRWGSPK